MAFCEEVERDVEFDSTTIKPLISGDPIALREMRGILKFKPTSKIWLSVNDLPRARPDDAPLWRRVAVVPFREQVPLMERNPLLKDELIDREASGPGVLNWALAGLRAWKKGGLGTCDAVEKATTEYRRWQDPVSLWLDECLDGSDNGHGERMNTAEAYRHFAGWIHAKGNGLIPVPSAEFSRQLSRHLTYDLQRVRKPGQPAGKATRGWNGLKLKRDI